MSETFSGQDGELHRMLRSISARLRQLTVAVVLMALALFALCAVGYGYLVEYHSMEPLLVGSALSAAALVGFGFGFFAGRRK